MRMHRYTLSTRTNLTLALLTIPIAPLCTSRVLAQEHSVIQQFIGAWEGHGTLFGTDATFTMKWEWVLERRFLHLTFKNQTRSRDGTERILRAQAFYLPIGEGRFEGTWFDSRGMVLPLQGSAEQTTLTTLWGTQETERGRTVYRLLNESELEVEDSVWRGDQLHEFGRATYGRVATDP